MTRIAFLGTGAMGGRMAWRFLAAGHDLVVWNRTEEKAAALIAAGATPAASPAEAARDVDVVITMLAGPAALAEVTEGAGGVARTVNNEAVVIDMSTVGPAAVHRLRATLPDDVGLIDAPVLGSISEVEAGTLHVFLGGPNHLIDRYTPLLAVLGETHHVGPLGAGAAAKLVANSTLLGTLGVLGEALALADRLGLARDRAFDVLAATPLGAQADRRRSAVESGEFPVRFALSLARKDADLVTEAAGSADADLRLGAAVRSWFADAEAAGWGERDYSAVLAYIGNPRETA